MKKTILFSLLMSNLAVAQPALDLAKSWGGKTVDEALDVAIDTDGNTYVCGYFNGEADFDPDPTKELRLVSAGKSDVFLQKFDKNGDLLWAKSWGNALANIGYAVALDEAGAVYVASITQRNGTYMYGNVCSFSPEVVWEEKDEQDGTQVLYIKKLNTNGETLWMAQFFAAPKISPTELKVSGYSCLLGASIGSFTEKDKTQHTVVSLNTNMDIPHAQAFGHYTLQIPEEKKYLEDEPYFDCSFDAVNTIGNERIFALNNNILYYINNQKLTARNLATKAILYEKDCPAYLQDMTADAQGNIYLAGKKGKGIYIEKISADGKKEWHKEYNELSTVTALEAAGLDAVYVSGKNEDKIAMAKIDQKGAMLWSSAVGGTEKAQIYNIAARKEGGVAAVGYFSQEMDNALLRPNGKGGANDGFLLRWAADAPALADAVENRESQLEWDLAPAATAFLYACYPNPSSHSTTIHFNISGEAQAVKLNLYDATGKLLQCFFSGQVAGEQKVLLDVSALPSGLYFYQLQTADKQLIQQLVKE